MKVICKLPNASELINGVVFKQRGDVMVSEDIAEDVAKEFATITGYEILPESKKEDKKASNPAP